MSVTKLFLAIAFLASTTIQAREVLIRREISPGQYVDLMAVTVAEPADIHELNDCWIMRPGDGLKLHVPYIAQLIRLFPTQPTIDLFPEQLPLTPESFALALELFAQADPVEFVPPASHYDDVTAKPMTFSKKRMNAFVTSQPWPALANALAVFDFLAAGFDQRLADFVAYNLIPRALADWGTARFDQHVWDSLLSVGFRLFEDEFRTAAFNGPWKAVPVTEKLENIPLAADGHWILGQENFSFHAAFSPNGTWLASNFVDGTIQLRDLQRPGARPFVLRGPSGSVTSIVFSRDGKWLAAGSYDGMVRLWNLEDLDAEPRILTRNTGRIYAVAISSDGKWLAASSYSYNGIQLWSLGDLDAQLRILTVEGVSRAASVAFSPDGKWLAAGLYSRIHLWNLEHLDAEPRILEKRNTDWEAVAFSPDDKWLASGSYSGIHLWNLEYLDAEPRTLAGYQVASVAFSPDGKWLASSSADRAIRLWNLATPDAAPPVLESLKYHKRLETEHAAEHELENPWIKSAVFSPNDEELFVVDSNGLAYLYRPILFDDIKTLIRTIIPMEEPSRPIAIGGLAVNDYVIQCKMLILKTLYGDTFTPEMVNKLRSLFIQLPKATQDFIVQRVPAFLVMSTPAE